MFRRTRRRRIHRRSPTPGLWALLILGALATIRGATQSNNRHRSNSVAVIEEVAEVQRAIDGDTLLLRDGRRIRLLGVDTPETKHPQRPAEPFGEEASQFTSTRVNRQTVRLVYDRERQDDYGRWLVYLFLGEECFNETLIRQGYSRAIISFPFRSDMQRRFVKAEEQAREEGLGIWTLVSPEARQGRGPARR